MMKANGPVAALDDNFRLGLGAMMKIGVKLLLVGLVLLIIFPGFVLAREVAVKEEAYLIGRDDVLEISVWQSPDLSKALTVGSDGTIIYPILGSLPVAGLTPDEVQKDIQTKLAQGYVKEPKVTISIKEYNSKKIMVFGEVQKPGLYKLKGKIPLLELLFLVGGVKSEAKRMTVIRPSSVGENVLPPGLNPQQTTPAAEQDLPKPLEVDLIALLSRGDLSQNIFIQPADTVYVSAGTGARFYVLGQVKKPGPYEWVEAITVLEAIKLAGGNTEKAALNRIIVRQMGVDGKVRASVKINVAEIMQGKKKDDVLIKSGDVVVVPESWI